MPGSNLVSDGPGETLPSFRLDRLSGTLLGTALGDALGLACEGLSARAIARRFGQVERFHILGRTGFVSDDTELSALVAQSLISFPDDPVGFERAFGRALAGWFLRLPWGIGLATLRASIRRLLGIRPSGVFSAGNGAAMRAAIVGTFFREEPRKRREFSLVLAQVTHRDPRAVEGALFVAEMAAACAKAGAEADRFSLWEQSMEVLQEPSLTRAARRAKELAEAGMSTEEAAAALGTTGFVVHTVPFATYCFLRYGEHPHRAIKEAIQAGGDTDTIGAIVGAWVGALHGDASLRDDLIRRIHDGPFGPTHLRALARALHDLQEGREPQRPSFSVLSALARNVCLYPVILAHGLRQLIPI